ncbi:mediator of RNA polymerase II transcription subunit 8-B [Strongylocentrotus purpuratus]|uniref:Mediator of RNA polymerase II transcription subunit 8 n=1 Tax=Strongylocentrotus purpuratus TaxID=7668 RepID=A0A7M7PJU7_STRPU|nr:mediator of RNA polymerase II transcription subunit 8-B [Strongylocentrotus purpuratus]
MQNQDKVLDNSLDYILSRVNDLKKALTDLLMKLEHHHETLNWPSVLNSFALLSGQINTLNRHLKSDKTPVLKNLIILPLKLSQDRDEELEKVTEGRVASFNHDVVPNYLRTKPEPESEEREQVLAKDAAQLSPEVAKKQIDNLNRLSTHLLSMLASQRETWDPDSSKLNITTSSPSDTNMLVGAVNMGRGFKRGMVQQPMSNMGAQMARQGDQHAPVGKIPSGIRTNIKSGGGHFNR